MGMSLVLQVYRYKREVLDKMKYWPDGGQTVTNVITIHPEGNMNVWTKFNGNPSNSGWDIYVVVDLPINKQTD